METAVDKLLVTSHVSRDLLQSAALFKNDSQVVWEYVSNGLQYVDPGVNPEVRVRLDGKNKRIEVRDNGRGMLLSDLRNFFVMHGENVDRKVGRAGRGVFGTGKSAAFGIAERLVVTSVRSGLRTKVSLSQSGIKAMKGGADIPVDVIESEVPTEDNNGTLVEIEDIHLRKLDQKRVIAFIQRHLANWSRGGITVWVNNHECQYEPPPASQTFTVVPDDEIAARLGECTLVLNVASRPLNEEERGVAIFTDGVWCETTLVASGNRDMAGYIFGEIEVPELGRDKSPVAPFDMSRSMKLNPENELVQLVYGFVGSNIEKLRKQLVVQERDRKATEDAKRLQKQAGEISDVINNDFAEFSQRLRKAHSRAAGGTDLGYSEPSGEQDYDFVFGGGELAEVIAPSGSPGSEGGGGSDGDEPRDLNPAVQPGSEQDPKIGKTAGGGGSTRRRPRGGFSIDFRGMGELVDRAEYNRDERQIVINLDHPQFSAALGSGTIEDLTFRRLACEVAFTEYAIALAIELAQREEYFEITDPIVDIRATINRVARLAASLYEAA